MGLTMGRNFFTLNSLATISQRLLLVLLAHLCAASAFAQGTVIVCEVSGMIDEGIAVVVERAVKEAESTKAKALVLRIDTPGGRVDSAIKIATAIQGCDVKTIAFIEGMGAISAGALISYACDEMAMTPGTNIGAATPVIASAEGMQPTGEKEVSFVRAKMRALAESNGYNADVAQAMVDEDIELRGYRETDGTYRIYSVTHEPDGQNAGTLTSEELPVSPIERFFRTISPEAPLPTETPKPEPSEPKDDTEPAVEEGERETPRATAARPGTVVFEDGSELLDPRGKLLTLTPEEAIRFGLIKETTANLDALAEQQGFGAVTFREIVATWSEDLFRWLTSPTVAGLLMLLAIGGLYFEVQTPGFGLPGAIGLVCLALLLGSHYIVGLADVIDLVLILAGVCLILLEVFVFPGFGVAGAAGVICLAMGMYFSLVDFTIPQYSWEFDRFFDVLYSFALAMGLFVVLAAITWRMLPRTTVFNWVIMGGAQPVSEGYTVQTEGDIRAAIGLSGVATSMLRPAGRGRFGEKTYSIVTRGEFIDKETPIRIINVEGNRYVVEATQSALTATKGNPA